jgi:L-ribulose-5-phosphate 3-epimerase
VVRLGARAHDLGRGDGAFLARAASEAGASCLQLAPAKSLVDCPPPPEPMAPSWARSVAAALAARGVGVAVLGCYVDLCGPSAESRRAARARLSHNLSIAGDFGTRVVATETPLSGGEARAALRFLREAVAPLAEEAEAAGALLCLEPVWGHALSSPRAMAELLSDIGSRALGVILDPVNLVDPGSSAEGASAALEALELFGDRVAAVHVKDYVIKGGSKAPSPPGTGLMDWPRVARAVAAAAPEGLPFIVEEQDGPGFAAGLALIRTILGP